MRASGGVPLKKAYVHLKQDGAGESAKAYGAQTGESGRFCFTSVQPGTYSLTVERVGFVKQAYGEGGGGHEALLTIAPGKGARGLLFRMTPWSVISGRITNEDGDPQAHVKVEALLRRMRDGKRQMTGSGYAQTNDLGEFRIWGLRKGRYYVRAEKSSGEMAAPANSLVPGGTEARVAYAPVYYPGTTEAAQAATVEVRSAEEAPGVNFILVPTHAFRVAGRVTIAVEGKSNRAVSLTLARMDGGMWDFTRNALATPPKLSYSFDDVTSGEFLLMAWVQVDGKGYSFQRQIQVGNSDLENVDVAIGRAAAVQGRLTIEGQRGPLPAGAFVYLNAPGSIMSTERADVRPDGSFTISDVSEGVYDVEYSVPGVKMYLKAVHVVGKGASQEVPQEVQPGALSVGPGGLNGQLEIVLGTAGATLEGTVTDANGLPVPGAVTVLVPAGALRKVYRFYERVATDQNGKFVFRDVRPGEYTAFSWADVEEDDWQDPDFLKPVEEKGVRVSLKENGQETRDLKVIAATGATKP